MVIPTQPPLTATKKSTPKSQAPGGLSSTLPSSASPVAKSQSHTAPQPVPASYATASTPSQPTFNVQVRSAQPGPQHQAPGGQQFGQQPIRSPAQVQYMPAQPKGPDFAYGPPQPGFSPMAQGVYQEQQPGARRAEPAPVQAYQPAGPKKTYITDVPSSLAPYTPGPAIPPKVRCFSPCRQQHPLTAGRSFSYYKYFKEKSIKRSTAGLLSITNIPLMCSSGYHFHISSTLHTPNWWHWAKQTSISISPNTSPSSLWRIPRRSRASWDI